MIFMERVTWKRGWRQVPEDPDKPVNYGREFAFPPSTTGILGECKHWNGTLVFSVYSDKPGCCMENGFNGFSCRPKVPVRSWLR
jgi:hypothetical protein